MGKHGILIAAAGLLAASSACTREAVEATSPDFVLRAAKPISPPPSGITVISLGSLPHSSSVSGAPIALALNTGSSRATTRAAGYTEYGTTKDYPFTWTSQSGILPLPIAGTGHWWPNGVSAAGQIVGEQSASDGNHAFLVVPGGSMSFLPVPAGVTLSKATGISADGTCISGGIALSDGWRSVLWRNGALEIVGIGIASGVSDDCLVVSGFSAGRASVWRFTSGSWVVETLPSAGVGTVTSNGILYSETTDISPSGEYVAGRRLENDSVTHAVVWHHTSSGWISADMPGQSMYAFGVNDAGNAVGNNGSGYPTYWSKASDGPYSAQILPPLEKNNNAGWAAAINELGQIVGRSRTRTGFKPVMWTLPN